MIIILSNNRIIIINNNYTNHMSSMILFVSDILTTNIIHNVGILMIPVLLVRELRASSLINFSRATETDK